MRSISSNEDPTRFLDWSTATWPSGADSSALKSRTIWTYYNNSDLVSSKQYPPDGTGNNQYQYTYYTPTGDLYYRYAQRGSYSLWTGRGYDAFGRLKVVDYSDATPDAFFTYQAHSGFLESHAEGTSLASVNSGIHTGGFNATRTTSYATRANGAVTAETLVDNGETITLERPYAANGRQSGLKLTWGNLGAAPEQSYSYDNYGRLFYISTTDTNGRSIWTNLSRSASSRSVEISVQDGGSSYSSYTYDIHGRVSSEYSNYDTFRNLRWDRDRLVSRGRPTTADRWEYRYNSRGEVSQGWKQFGASVTTPTAGEVKAGTGAIYRYDDIGNRTQSDEVGRAALSGDGTSVPTAIDTTSGNTSLRTTSYGTTPTATTTANALNQYTRIARPAFFNVRGTRAAGATIRVNGDLVDLTNSSDSGYQPNQNGTYFRDEVPNTTPSGTTSPDLFEPVKVTSNNNPFTVEDPVQYVAPPLENLTYDADGNLLTDGRWTYTWDGADRLIRMESQPFQQPAYGAAPLDLPQVQVKGLKVEFAYDAFSRRIRKKVSEKNLAPGSLWELKTHEAYVYDGWNMIASYALHTTGPNAGKGKERMASHVWGPDIGSNPAAGRDWQAAGGVGGLIMTLNPPPAANPISYEDWLGNQGIYSGNELGYSDYYSGTWVPWDNNLSTWYGPDYYLDANSNYVWVDYQSGYYTPYGFMMPWEMDNYGWGYSQYSYEVLARYDLQIPTMDHMGNVISVVRLKCQASGEVTSQTEFVYDYDAFGKEIRSSALIAGNNPDSYPFHYSTKFTDAETGLVYYGYRFYDPVNGRWINRDPIGEDGGLNLYEMVGNETVTGVDYLGYFDVFTHTRDHGHVGVSVNGTNYDAGRYAGKYRGGTQKGPNILKKNQGAPTCEKEPEFTRHHFNLCPEVDNALQQKLEENFKNAQKQVPDDKRARTTNPNYELKENERYTGERGLGDFWT